jgi:hypothetical protein
VARCARAALQRPRHELPQRAVRFRRRCRRRLQGLHRRQPDRGPDARHPRSMSAPIFAMAARPSRRTRGSARSTSPGSCPS